MALDQRKGNGNVISSGPTTAVRLYTGQLHNAVRLSMRRIGDPFVSVCGGAGALQHGLWRHLPGPQEHAGVRSEDQGGEAEEGGELWSRCLPPRLIIMNGDSWSRPLGGGDSGCGEGDTRAAHGDVRDLRRRRAGEASGHGACLPVGPPCMHAERPPCVMTVYVSSRTSEQPEYGFGRLLPTKIGEWPQSQTRSVP